MRTKLAKWSVLLLLLLGLPLLGVALAGHPLDRYLEFPPITRYVEHTPLSWLMFVGLTVFVLGTTGPFLLKILTSPLPAATGSLARHPFPWWGWLGVGITAVAWVLAWNRFAWLGDLQRHTFTPLWIGYILVVNALAFGRSGRCLLLDRPRFVLALFPLSAAFWWFFEYLNRFVQNWYYEGISDIGPLEYFLYATPPFATVLPAVLSTTAWLATFPRLDAPLRNLWPIRIPLTRVAGWAVLLVSGAGLMGIGLWPDYLFPLLWISPLLVITALQAICGEETVFARLRHGDWRPVWVPALAALLCGFFWELWNFGSLAHWEYAVPYVHEFQLFEMPLLGYAGYLPFGLECVVIAAFLLPSQARNSGENQRG